MPRKKHLVPKPKTRLTLSDRIVIESGLDSGQSIREIARELGKDPSSISREIARNTQTQKSKERCANFADCRKKKICKDRPGCNRPCRTCSVVSCKKVCDDFCPVEQECPKNLVACNSCKSKRLGCKYAKKIYSAETADNEAHSRATNSRDGFNMTLEEFTRIDEIVSPMLKNGMSPYAVLACHPDLGISIQTLYRLIEHGELSADNFALRSKLSRKPRKGMKKRTMNREIVSKLKEGRRYEDYLIFMETYDGPVIQMDTVLGKQDEGACLLTLHMPQFHFQLAMLLDKHTSPAVVRALDILEEALGTDLFHQVFPVILTDNGSEFMMIEAMERSCLEPDRQRTKIFFCETNRSDQKGSCENNHKYIRYILPKGTSMEPLTQSDINLMMCHVNSYARNSLYGRTPFQMAKDVLPEDFFDLLGLEEVEPKDLCLRPELLTKCRHQM
ncbi:MAG: IS30 family transposase [Lachnospiraceae bacterium]|nr:IS30 family transposase [Lachnospiraceae bacterium]